MLNKRKLSLITYRIRLRKSLKQATLEQLEITRLEVLKEINERHKK